MVANIAVVLVGVATIATMAIVTTWPLIVRRIESWLYRREWDRVERRR